MRTLLSFLFASTLAFSQQMPEGNPEDIGRLQKDEIVRVYRRGGLTRRGPNWSLVVVKKNLKVFVKGVNGSFSSRLSRDQGTDLQEAIKATNWSAITATKRSGLPPSASDGVDIYLSYREGALLRKWSNVKFEFPSEIPILEALQSY